MLPEMVPVDSSAIAAIGYDARVRELFVRFHTGRTYVYEEVPPDLYQELMQAASKGICFNTRIKPDHPVREV